MIEKVTPAIVISSRDGRKHAARIFRAGAKQARTAREHLVVELKIGFDAPAECAHPALERAHDLHQPQPAHHAHDPEDAQRGGNEGERGQRAALEVFELTPARIISTAKLRMKGIQIVVRTASNNGLRPWVNSGSAVRAR